MDLISAIRNAIASLTGQKTQSATNPSTMNAAVTQIQQPKQPPLIADPNTWAAYQNAVQKNPSLATSTSWVSPNGQPLTSQQAQAMAIQPNAAPVQNNPMQQAQQTLTTQQPKPTLPPTNREIEGFTNWNPPSQYADIVKQASTSHGVPAAFIAGVIQNENGGWTPNVRDNVNSDGSRDRGFAQISNVSHPEVTDQQARDPNFAINFVAQQLANKYKQFGSWPKAILAYNGFNGTNDYLNNALKNIDPEYLQQLGLKSQY